MTVDEAIRYQKDLKRVLLHKGEVEYAKSTQLGIEALQRIKANRRLASPVFIALLPGETEE